METRILLTFDNNSRCSFCTVQLKIGKGIVLQECLHPFCRPCLVTWIKSSKDVNIKCPMECGSMLLKSEIIALVGRQWLDDLELESYEKALNDDPGVLKCWTLNCTGFCVVEEGSKVFLCPVCNKTNCVQCRAIHNGLTCEEYEGEKRKCYQSNPEDPERYLRETVDKRSQTSGFEQLVASASLQNTNATYFDLMFAMSQQRIALSTKEFECKICFTDVPAGEGVILRDCIHLFCKDCLISHIEHSEDPQVRCPHEGCSSILSPREISALLPQAVVDKVNKRNWSLAEAIIGSKFHCLTVNCDGFCELEGNVNAFWCEICLKTSCIGCNAIHEDMSCKAYQDEVKLKITNNTNDQLSKKEVENLIATGRAMRCSKCKACVEKSAGCDAITCVMCKTELCWATKGPRWGPRGKGDTSGGCKCNYGGVRCHPKCGNCH